MLKLDKEIIYIIFAGFIFFAILEVAMNGLYNLLNHAGVFSYLMG